MRRGTVVPRSIADTAPLVGTLGAVAGLINVLRSAAGCGYGECAGGPSETLIPMLLSLPVAILASLGLHWLNRTIETFGLEMRTAGFELLEQFAFGNDVAKSAYQAPHYQ